ncbi:unnamed protein product [Brassica oleracea]
MKVEGKMERVITSLKSEKEDLSERISSEISRCFELEVEVAEVRQKLKTMETLEKKLELLHRQRAVASEQAAANMNGKRQSSVSWKWTKLLKN